MRSQVRNSCLYVSILVSIILLGGVGNAQDSPKPAAGERQTSKPQVPVAKKLPPATATPAEEDDLDKSPAAEADKDSPEQIRKRVEWFYKQRSSVKGHIPAGARSKAFQHLQRMLLAEGKLALRPDGSYTEAAPQSFLSSLSAVTSAWSSIGPTPTTGGFFSPVTGRITTIAVDPSDSTGNTVLIGGAMGGIWRTTDGGQSWTAVGDQNASLAMGSIAFAPSTPSVVYAGTGESESIGFDIYYGAGVLKSLDHGQTWTQTCTVPSSTCPFIGPYDDITPFGFFTLGGTRITYVAVNPANPQMVLVGAQTQFSQGITEGVYCSDNSGTTWSNILPDQLSSFVGFASSTVAYAALGNPFGSSPNAPNGNGIYKATNIGTTCTSIVFSRLTTTTLPLQSSMGRIDIGIAPSDTLGNTVYASIADASTASDTNLGVFVTTNGGTSWTPTLAPDICQHQCWYDNVVKVDPTNKNIVYIGGGAVTSSTAYEWVMRSTGGTTGASFSSVLPTTQGPGLPHVDVHAITLFKATSGTFSGKVRAYLGNDGGVWRADDAEASTITWTNLNNSSLTLTQFYPSISINASSPALAFGGTQDNGSQNYQGGLSWVDNQLCGDGASSAVDFAIPSTVYIGCATGAPINASYQNGALGTFFPAVNGINSSDFASFIPPLAADPIAANTLYYGTTKVYQSTDAGNTWTAISNDLVYGPNGLWLNSIAPANSSVVYAAANSGQVFVATNVAPGSLANFNQVAGQGNLPPREVTAVVADTTDATGNTAYATFSGFAFVSSTLGVNDPTGHIFKTADGGNTWKDVSCSAPVCTTPAATDLPNIPVNDLVVDPDVTGAIYAATDLGVFAGDCSSTPCKWTSLGTGLPRAAVLSLRLHEASRTLRAATHGRGAWDIFLNNFPFSGPRIFSLSPTSASSGAAPLTLTVNGTGLTGGTIQFNGAPLATTVVQADTQLTAQVATSLLVAGTPKVTVKVGSTISNSVTFSVLASVPTLTAINPPSTPVQTPTPTTNVPIQLTGTGFASSAKVLFNGVQNGITVAASTSSCPLPTCLKATLPAALLGPFGSTNDIAVLNTPPGGGQSKPVAFKVAAPAPPNDNFANATNITTLTLNDVQDSSSATTESADPVPPCVNQYTSAQGNTGGQKNGVYNTIWYKFTPIFASNLSVDTIGSSYDSVLSIWTGTGTTEATLTATNVACNDDIVQGVNIQSQLSSVPLTAGTTYYIMVSSFGPPDSNPIALGGKSQFNFSYNFGNYPSPVLTSIMPTSANSGGPAFTLTITGSSFFNGSILNFDDTANSLGAAVATTYVSPTQLTAVIPASLIALPGPFTVLVLSPPPNYAPSNSLPFTINLGTYPVPILTSIGPTTVIAGSFPFQLIATGSNFAPSAVLNFNGVPQTTSVAPSAQNAYAVISTAAISTPGTVQVTVTNPLPGGGPSVAQPFVITQPTAVPNITSVNPATFPGGIPTNLTLTGTGFTQGATLNVGGPSGNYYSTNFVSATQLSLPGFAVNGVGTFPSYVIDPAPAGTSAAFNLIVTQPPTPAITSISPTTAQSNSTVNLTINGTNFQPGANVMFNNQNNFTYSTTFVNATQLTTTLVLGGVSAGTYPLVVVNPVPSPTSSAPFNFIVTGPPDFSITSSGTTTVTVPAGQTATFANAISIAAQNGFSAQVNLTCLSPATATTCSVNPPSFPSGSGSASVMVTTMARGTVPPVWPRLRFISRPQFLPVSLLLVLLSVLLLRFARTRRQRFIGALPLVILVLVLTMEAVGCGGGYTSPPPPPPPTGTPAGTYSITVTATSGTLTHSSTLTLTVQ